MSISSPDQHYELPVIRTEVHGVNKPFKIVGNKGAFKKYIGSAIISDAIFTVCSLVA